MATVATVGVRPHYQTPKGGKIEAATDTPIIAAPGAGLRLVVQYLKLRCPSSNSGVNEVDIVWGNTEVDSIELAAGEGISYYFESGNEWILSENVPLVLTTSSAEKLEWSARWLVESAG